MTDSLRPRAWFPRSLAAAALLAAMLLGAFAHGWHHLSDQGCDDALPRHADACAVCAALHAAPIPEAAAQQAAPAAIEHRAHAPAPASAPGTGDIAVAPARAPPAA